MKACDILDTKLLDFATDITRAKRVHDMLGGAELLSPIPCCAYPLMQLVYDLTQDGDVKVLIENMDRLSPSPDANELNALYNMATTLYPIAGFKPTANCVIVVLLTSLAMELDYHGKIRHLNGIDRQQKFIDSVLELLLAIYTPLHRWNLSFRLSSYKAEWLLRRYAGFREAFILFDDIKEGMSHA